MNVVNVDGVKAKTTIVHVSSVNGTKDVRMFWRAGVKVLKVNNYHNTKKWFMKRNVCFVEYMKVEAGGEGGCVVQQDLI